MANEKPVTPDEDLVIPLIKGLHDWTQTDVTQWLKSCNLEEFASDFFSSKINGIKFSELCRSGSIGQVMSEY